MQNEREREREKDRKTGRQIDRQTESSISISSNSRSTLARARLPCAKRRRVVESSFSSAQSLLRAYHRSSAY